MDEIAQARKSFWRRFWLFAALTLLVFVVGWMYVALQFPLFPKGYMD